MATLAGLQTRSMYGPNLVLLMLGLSYLVVHQYSVRGVERLVVTSPASSQRIVELERRLARNPADVAGALELGRLYGTAGEFPWAYDALRHAEQRGSTAPRWRMRLALVYLEIGRNEDGKRALGQARRACEETSCSANTRVWLQLIGQLTELLEERGIDAREHPERAEAALREVLKPTKAPPKAPTAEPRDSGSDPGISPDGSASLGAASDGSPDSQR